MIRAHSLAGAADDQTPVDTVTLTWEDRFRRRMAMTGDRGTAFLLDLPEVVELRHGDRLCLDNGALVEVRAAAEALMEAEASDPLHLARIAWHVGNRHLPCELRADRIVLRADHVIADMLERLGCRVTHLHGSFTPEGGAYGAGRTQGHSHGEGHARAHEDASAPAHHHPHG